MINYYTTLKNLYMYTTLEEFQKHNPPCNECLIQSMCIDYRVIPYKAKGATMQIKVCKEFNKFINSNENFIYQYRF